LVYTRGCRLVNDYSVIPLDRKVIDNEARFQISKNDGPVETHWWLPGLARPG
jgi:hypothetical protein